MYCADLAMFPEKFHFGQERRISPQICQWWDVWDVWDYPTLFLWDNPTFFSIYPTSIPQKGVVHFCRPFLTASVFSDKDFLDLPRPPPFSQNQSKKSEYFLIRIFWIGRDPPPF